MLCLFAQSRLTLCDPMDYSPPGSSVHGDSPGKNTEVRCRALLQGIFPTQGSNPHLLCLLLWQTGFFFFFITNATWKATSAQHSDFYILQNNHNKSSYHLSSNILHYY